ncbi:hypothetical protein D3C86_1664030 [compost metagenome]
MDPTTDPASTSSPPRSVMTAAPMVTLTVPGLAPVPRNRLLLGAMLATVLNVTLARPESTRAASSPAAVKSTAGVSERAAGTSWVKMVSAFTCMAPKAAFSASWVVAKYWEPSATTVSRRAVLGLVMVS